MCVCAPHTYTYELFVSNHTQQSDAIPFTNTRSSGKELMMRRGTRNPQNPGEEKNGLKTCLVAWLGFFC